MIKEQTVLSALSEHLLTLTASHQNNAIKLTYTEQLLVLCLCFIRELFVTFCKHVIALPRMTGYYVPQKIFLNPSLRRFTP